jgi:hypothetical protein
LVDYIDSGLTIRLKKYKKRALVVKAGLFTQNKKFKKNAQSAITIIVYSMNLQCKL